MNCQEDGVCESVLLFAMLNVDIAAKWSFKLDPTLPVHASLRHHADLRDVYKSGHLATTTFAGLWKMNGK